MRLIYQLVTIQQGADQLIRVDDENKYNDKAESMSNNDISNGGV